MSKPPVLALGQMLHVLNAVAFRKEPEVAVVTRVWSSHGAEVGMVNLTVLPDAAEPVCKTSVPVFAGPQEAAKHLAGFPGHNPIVAYWPALG